jgi:hypothetical protein
MALSGRLSDFLCRAIWRTHSDINGQYVIADGWDIHKERKQAAMAVICRLCRAVPTVHTGSKPRHPVRWNLATTAVSTIRDITMPHLHYVVSGWMIGRGSSQPDNMNCLSKNLCAADCWL